MRNKKILLSAVSVILSLALILSAWYVTLFAIGGERRANVRPGPSRSASEPLAPTISFSSSTVIGGFAVDENGSRGEYKTFGDAEAEVRDGFLVGYKTPSGTVGISTRIGTGIEDSVFYNGERTVTKFYAAGDMLPDIMIFGESSLSTLYNGERLEALLINDALLSGECDNLGRMISVELSEKTERGYTYGASGEILTETLPSGEVISYTYEDGRLTGSASLDIATAGGRVVYNRGGEVTEYIFGHEFSGERYLTEIRRAGKTVATYSYINGAVASAVISGERIDYILDSELNTLGMVRDGNIYYYVYDLSGNVLAVTKSDGAVLAFTDATAYGLPSLDGGVCDIVIASGRIYDSSVGAAILRDKVIFTEGRVKASPGASPEALSAEDALVNGGSSVYGKRGGVSYETAVRAAIVDEAMAMLEDMGYSTAANVPIVNGDGEYVDFADLYITNPECAGDKVKNAFIGDRIFMLVGTSDDRDGAIGSLGIYTGEDSGYVAEYYGSYPVTAGGVVFEGQFVYCDRLISYRADRSGIIDYKITANDPSLYGHSNNIYSYDLGAYLVFSDDAFSLSEWEYTALIPGINREQYDVVETYISDALEISAAAAYDSVEYYDREYYDSYVNSAMGDTLRQFAELDERAMVTLSSSGGITVKAIPFAESSEVRREFVKAVATAVVATAVVGFISVAVPGSGVFLFAILKTAIITGATSFAGTMVMSFAIDYAKENILGIEINETLDERLYRYYSSAIDSYYTGLVTGAIIGTLQCGVGVIKAKHSLSVKETAGSRMKLELSALDDRYPSYLLDDDLYAFREYERAKIAIERTYNATVSSASVRTASLTGSKTDNFIISLSLKGFNTANSFGRFITGGENGG